MRKDFIESFKGQMRDVLLKRDLFRSRDHARSIIAKWAEDYTTA